MVRRIKCYGHRTAPGTTQRKPKKVKPGNEWVLEALKGQDFVDVTGKRTANI